MRKFFFYIAVLLFSMAGAAQQRPQNFEAGYRGKSITGLKSLKGGLNFLVIGDWGRNGEYFQKEVAEQLGYAANQTDAEFIVTTGDNFYPNGVRSINDPQWQTSFENIYKAHALQVNWFVTLGNHDYRGNPDAQIQYSNISRRWNLPARYYSKTFSIDDDTANQVLMIFIDTDPFVKKYYKEEVYKEEVSKQDTAAQKAWLKNVLQNRASTIKWTIVVGHHPLYTGGKRLKSADTKDILNSFGSLLEQNKVDAYICGHEHNLQYIKPSASYTHFFVSGAGSEARQDAQLHPDGGKLAVNDHGFMSFSFTAAEFLMQVINAQGKVLYSTQIKKQ
ncbi:MAG: acid phosphatase [Lacibacter sp.]|jgi:predicted MPP superfamily phosphohydrolase